MIARRNYFIFFREKEDCRCLNCLRIRNAVEISRNLQRDRTRKQPEIPPPKPAQDHLAQRQRIMQNQSGDRPLPGDMERSRAAQARSVEHNWSSSCVAFEFIKRGDCCRSDPGKPRRSGAPTKSRIIHSPNLDSSPIPFFRLGCDPAVRAISVAVEAQNVNVRAGLLLRSIRLCRPNFQFAILKRNHFAGRLASIDRCLRRKEN